MSQLHADFEVVLSQPLHVRGESHGDSEWKLPGAIATRCFMLDDFSFRLDMVPDGVVSIPARGAILEVALLRLRVSHDESEPPPPTDEFRARVDYFDQRRSGFIKAATKVTDRVIKFARYRLGVSGASDVHSVASTSFNNPMWSYDEGGRLDCGTTHLEGTHTDPERDFGAGVLETSTAEALGLALIAELVVVPLHRELQSLGKDAACSGDLRRAVVELAVASEVAVKQTFFAPHSPASEAFDFLEEKRKVEVSVIELLKQPAQRAFGKNFSEVDAAAFGHLEELFRCRNKVAHRGKLEFRDSKGNSLRSADRTAVISWWQATETLLNWLETDCGLSRIEGL